MYTRSQKQNAQDLLDALPRWDSKRFGGVGCPKIKTRTEPARLICMHSTEGNQLPDAERRVASWADNPAAKGNYNIIAGRQPLIYADITREAWHANAANPYSIGVSIPAKAAFTRDEWLSGYTLDALWNAAEICAALCIVSDIEVALVSDEKLKQMHANGRNKRGDVSGFVAHAQVSKALKSGTHTDPGPNFPWLDFLLGVRGHVELLDG